MSLCARQLQRMELATRRQLVRGNGIHSSSLVGNGEEPDGLRDWMPSDDYRTIDWNASARTGRPNSLVTRKYFNDPDVTFSIVIDCAQRLNYGGFGSLMLSVDAALYAAISIATLALWQNDQVGVITTGSPTKRTPTTDDIRRIRKHLSEVQPGRDDAFVEVLQAFRKEREHAQVVVLISDFLGDGWQEPVTRLARMREVWAMQIIDPWDEHLPDVGEITMEGIPLNTSEESVRQKYDYEKAVEQAEIARALSCTRHMRLRTATRITPQLVALFTQDHRRSIRAS